MSQLGRISGPLLKANLLRNGVDLAFETDLLYLDVKNLRVGIKTANPTHDLTVNGTTRTTNLELTNSLTVGNLTFGNNTISSTQGEIQLNPAGGGTVFSGKITADEIDIFNNTISTNISNANLEFRPHGTGSVDIYSNATVNRYKAAISVVFSYACRNYNLADNPVRHIPSRPENNKRIRFLVK